MEDGDNPFVLLGLDAAKGELYPQDSSYSQDENQSAWKKMMLKHHPDRVKPKTPANIRKATRLSYKLNAARDLLLDLDEYRKWKEAAEDPSWQDDHDSGYPHYAKSDMPRRPRRPRATTPDGLGQPYEADFPQTPFSFDGDGSKGHAAPDGQPGLNGKRNGQHGTDGTNARAAGAGQDGKDLRIFIQVLMHEEGHFVLSAEATTGTEVLDPDADRLRLLPLKAFEKVEWSARGGNGGRGGHGGKGGKGHRGYNGRNATKSRRGRWSGARVGTK
jgi:curved DNA-binding protein CbpA